MTTLAKLLAQKQELIARLQQEDVGPEERDEIERLLEKIEAALDLLDKAGPSGPSTARVERVFNPDRKDHHWRRPKLTNQGSVITLP